MNRFFIIKASRTLSVDKRDFDFLLVPGNQSIGLNRRVTYWVYPDNPEDLKLMTIIWRSVNLQTNESFDLGHGQTKSIVPNTGGIHQVQVSVDFNGRTLSATAFVDVQPVIIASTEIPEFSPFDMLIGEPFAVTVLVHHLIPGCTATWTSCHDDDDDDGEAILGQVLTVNDMEENFLSELVEYGNSTVSGTTLLDIPAYHTNVTDLRSDIYYTFRLLITCPSPMHDYQFGDVEDRVNVTSYLDLVLKANIPPIFEPLEVSPDTGTALKTLFQFTTGAALDSPNDYPMRYTFMYAVAGILVETGTFYEHTVTTTELPYSGDPIETFYQVCDSRDACSVIQGPLITVTANMNLTESELDLRLAQIEGGIRRQDYDEMFKWAINLIFTLRYNAMFDTLARFLKTAVDVEGRRIKTQDPDTFLSSQEIEKFRKFSKIILDHLQ